jgi:hypothetical protein
MNGGYAAVLRLLDAKAAAVGQGAGKQTGELNCAAGLARTDFRPVGTSGGIEQ